MMKRSKGEAMRGVNLIHADDMNVDAEIGGKWVKARPIGWEGPIFRLKMAWESLRVSTML